MILKRQYAVLAPSLESYKYYSTDVIQKLEKATGESFKYIGNHYFESENCFMFPAITIHHVLGKRNWELLKVPRWYLNEQGYQIEEQYKLELLYREGATNDFTNTLQEDSNGENTVVEDMDRRVADKIRERSGGRR